VHQQLRQRRARVDNNNGQCNDGEFMLGAAAVAAEAAVVERKDARRVRPLLSG
jgi:hypothetical protein